MGLCGSLSGCAGAAWNNFKSNLDKAGSLIADCICSDTCTKAIGVGLTIAGTITYDPILIAIGVGVMAGEDAPDCASSSAMGWVDLALDAAVLIGGTPGLDEALGRGLGSVLSDETGAVRLGVNGETAQTTYGRLMHSTWDCGPGFHKEFALEAGGRVDSINFETAR
jgi:hypothetical protein